MIDLGCADSVLIGSGGMGGGSGVIGMLRTVSGPGLKKGGDSILAKAKAVIAAAWAAITTISPVGLCRFSSRKPLSGI
jgi:hypothetical protein